MNFVITRIGGEHHRIADPDWGDPLDASYAARDGQRWNPPGLACLYLNCDLAWFPRGAAMQPRSRRTFEQWW